MEQMGRSVYLICLYLLLTGILKSSGDKFQAKNKNDAQNIIRQNGEKKVKVKKDPVEPVKNPIHQQKIREMGAASLQFIKKKTENKIREVGKKINSSNNLSNKEKEFKHHLLTMFLEELSESEKDMLDAQEALKKSLTADFLDPKTLMENSKQRLDALRLATLKEEQSYLKIKTIEEAMENLLIHENTTSLSLMDELLEEIAHAADQLEVEIEDNIMQQNSLVDGKHIEAVLHMKEGDKQVEDLEADFDPGIDDERLDVLVDSQNNKFILSRPKDTTSPYIDHLLVLDLILIWLISFPLSVICNVLNIPSMFAYVMGGLFLGPSGANTINSMVQVESFGEFGVFFIMFSAGLEFSPDKLQKYWKVALQAPLLITGVMVISGVIIGSIFNSSIPKAESAFIAACLSLSSTPLVVKYLQGKSSDSSDYSSILLGMLIMQDILLSIIIAFMPTIAASKNITSYRNLLGRSFVMLGRTLLSICIISTAVVVIAKYFIKNFVQYIEKFSKETVLLGMVSFMFLMAMATNSLGVSMELGCFLAGVLMSMTSLHVTLETIISPIHDAFAVIFFATVGLHVFPSFVFTEFTMLIWLTIFVVAGKYFISLFVLQFVLPANQAHCRWLVSSGLAQVSEFSFVISSRARNLKILSREVYLLILSVTTLSLLMSPLLWKLSLWRYKKRQNIQTHTKI